VSWSSATGCLLPIAPILRLDALRRRAMAIIAEPASFYKAPVANGPALYIGNYRFDNML
jgi:hypothetical protein